MDLGPGKDSHVQEGLGVGDLYSLLFLPLPPPPFPVLTSVNDVDDARAGDQVGSGDLGGRPAACLGVDVDSVPGDIGGDVAPFQSQDGHLRDEVLQAPGDTPRWARAVK